MDKELELLISEKEVEVGGKQVVVKKISMFNTVRIASQISSVVAKVMEDTDRFTLSLAKVMYQPPEGEEDDMAVRLMGIVEIFGAIGDDGVDLLKNIITKSTNLTAEDAEELDIIEGVDILTSIYEVNKGFFVKCGKKLQEKMKKPTKTKKKPVSTK